MRTGIGIGLALMNSLVALLLIVLPATAATDSEPEADQRIDFVVGNLAFVMLHEFAHLVIDDFRIPNLGNQEDAADTLAAVTLIRLDRNHPERDFAFIRMLLMAADANRVLWQRGLERDNPDVYYFANHPLSVQRATRIACLVYGSDTELFEPLPDIVGIPSFRADWCDVEFADADHAWEWVRDTYIVKADGSQRDHRFRYGRAREPSHQAILDRLKDARVLERVLEVVGKTILLPEDILLKSDSCGSPNAYWDSDAREVVLCYELLEAFYNLSGEAKVKELEAQIRRFHRQQP